MDRFCSLKHIPNSKSVARWLEAVLSVTVDDTPKERMKYVDAFINNWKYITLHFQADTANKMFDSLCPGKFLPGELIWAAVYMENGYLPDAIEQLAESGAFGSGPEVNDPDRAGQLAVVSFLECEEPAHFITGEYQSIDAEQHLLEALKDANQHGISACEAFQTLYAKGSRKRPPIFDRICDQQHSLLEHCYNSNNAVGALISCQMSQDIIQVQIMESQATVNTSLMLEEPRL